MNKIDLSKFEALYDQFDGGHGLDHINRVRNLAMKLAGKYLPEKKNLVYAAATLHDIGLIEGRENHELNGAKMILSDKDLQKFFTKNEISEISDAVKEHRASSGNPQTILAKIISDADKASDSPGEAMRRAVSYGKIHMPELSEDQQVWRAAKHLKEKFGIDGTGRRTYFPESEFAIENTYKPIFEALDREDYSSLINISKS